jgi:hypothetical protein
VAPTISGGDESAHALATAAWERHAALKRALAGEWAGHMLHAASALCGGGRTANAGAEPGVTVAQQAHAAADALFLARVRDIMGLQGSEPSAAAAAE